MFLGDAQHQCTCDSNEHPSIWPRLTPNNEPTFLRLFTPSASSAGALTALYKCLARGKSRFGKEQGGEGRSTWLHMITSWLLVDWHFVGLRAAQFPASCVWHWAATLCQGDYLPGVPRSAAPESSTGTGMALTAKQSLHCESLDPCGHCHQAESEPRVIGAVGGRNQLLPSLLFHSASGFVSKSIRSFSPGSTSENVWHLFWDVWSSGGHLAESQDYLYRIIKNIWTRGWSESGILVLVTCCPSFHFVSLAPGPVC